jgi:predicted nucleic acid-binding protein
VRKANELNLNRRQVDRHGKPTPDLLIAGEAVLKSSSLATFNKKRRELLKGIIDVTEDDVDEIMAMDIVVTNED